MDVTLYLEDNMIPVENYMGSDSLQSMMDTGELLMNEATELLAIVPDYK